MTTATVPQPTEGHPASVEIQVIDTDVHVEPRSFEELVTYMDAPWRDRAFKDRVPFRRAGYTTFDVAGRMDAYPDTGDLGSDPDMVERHMFIDEATDYAILLPCSIRGY